MTERNICDMTPDNNLPVRILEAYLRDCGMKWEVSGLEEDKSKVYDLMNDAQDQRAKILKKAIDILKHHLKGVDLDDLPDFNFPTYEYPGYVVTTTGTTDIQFPSEDGLEIMHVDTVNGSTEVKFP